MESSKAGSAPIADAKSASSPVASPESDRPGNERPASPGATKPRKLIAYQLYFGLEARAFHAGARRILERVSVQGQHQVNIRTLSEDFHLDLAASGTLLRALLSGGLLYPDGNGAYEATERFRKYALARVVVPLLRSQAKDLLDRACALADDLNADSTQNPLLIETMMVSGSYLSRRDLMPELSLWLVLRRRPRSERQGSASLLSKHDAIRYIKAALKGLNHVVTVRVVSHQQKVDRPFSIVFQAKDVVIEPPPRAWDKLRDWSASIGQRVAPGQVGAAPAATPPDPEPLPQAPAELVTVQRGPRTLQRERSAWGTVGKRD